MNDRNRGFYHKFNVAAEGVRVSTDTPMCEGRYPVPNTVPKREEPFEVTYRCGKPAGHEGEHGPESPPSEIEQTNAAPQASASETRGTRDGLSPEVSPPAGAAPSDKKDVARYFAKGAGMGLNGVELVADPEGDLVHYQDYAALERELAEERLGRVLHENAASQLAQMAVDSLPSSRGDTSEWNDAIEAAAKVCAANRKRMDLIQARTAGNTSAFLEHTIRSLKRHEDECARSATVPLKNAPPSELLRGARPYLLRAWECSGEGAFGPIAKIVADVDAILGPTDGGS